jgi:hypothetical protein
LAQQQTRAELEEDNKTSTELEEVIDFFIYSTTRAHRFSLSNGMETKLGLIACSELIVDSKRRKKEPYSGKLGSIFTSKQIQPV